MEPMSPRRSSRTVIAGILPAWPLRQFRFTRFFCSFSFPRRNQERSFRICEIAQATGQEFRS